MGGYKKENTDESYQEAERIFEKYERLRNRRNQPAKVLSGGERRLLEISRALVMKPSVLLVDEPSIDLESRYIDMVFETLRDLQITKKNNHFSRTKCQKRTRVCRYLLRFSIRTNCDSWQRE